MRLYAFSNMYLSSLQNGLQTAHVVAEMFTKYTAEMQQAAILEHWAEEHKTIVILNAGYSEEIRSLIQFFKHTDNPLPWAYFCEGKDALDGALTCVGIIIPEEFYEAAKEIRGLTPEPKWLPLLQTDWERALAARLNNYGLAK